MVRLTERERHIADVLQGMVQPTIPDTIPGLDLTSFYRVALQEANVGGDFYDVFALEKGCYALIVGDLSGKGLAAAVQVGTLRNMLRFALHTGNTLAEAVTRLNNVLIANDLLSGFATLVVAAFDLPMKTLTYVSCGQEPGLLRRSVRGGVSELPPTGPVIGMNEAASYQEHVVSLAPGDTFALYTDGLTEAGPNRRELLGVSGLAALLQQTGGTSQEFWTMSSPGLRPTRAASFTTMSVCWSVPLSGATATCRGDPVGRPYKCPAGRPYSIGRLWRRRR